MVRGEHGTMKGIGLFAGAALIAAIVAFAAPAKAQVVTLRVESNLPAAMAPSISMHIFKDEAARLSDGAIEVEVVAGSPHGLKEIVDAVHVGRIFATWVGVGYFSRLVPEVAVLSLPFLSDNYDRARRAVSGPVGSFVAKKLDAKGFIVLAWMDQGEFHVINSKRPLKTLDDFKGLSIRVMPNATHIAAFQALGARPVAMDFKDVAAALRQGDIDGTEQNYSLAYASKLYESQKYLSDTRHFQDFNLLVANKTAFESLDPMQQEAVREAASIAAIHQNKILAEYETTALARLLDAGMQFDPLPPETRAALRRATVHVVDDVRKWVGADLVNKVLAANRTPAMNKAAGSDKGARR
jgi:TRAP-type transport system periplasmic protein